MFESQFEAFLFGGVFVGLACFISWLVKEGLKHAARKTNFFSYCRFVHVPSERIGIIRSNPKGPDFRFCFGRSYVGTKSFILLPKTCREHFALPLILKDGGEVEVHCVVDAEIRFPLHRHVFDVPDSVLHGPVDKIISHRLRMLEPILSSSLRQRMSDPTAPATWCEALHAQDWFRKTLHSIVWGRSYPRWPNFGFIYTTVEVPHIKPAGKLTDVDILQAMQNKPQPKKSIRDQSREKVIAAAALVGLRTELSKEFPEELHPIIERIMDDVEARFMAGGIE